MHAPEEKVVLYGMLAEFDTPESLTEATQKTIQAGYRKLDAYSPFPISDVSELVASVRQTFHALPYLVLAGGFTGAILGFLLQYWVAAVEYPLNIGGRPYNSWPAFIIIIFEMTILLAASTAVFGMFGLNALPQPYHLIFNSENFSKKASSDGFFLCIEANDPQFDVEKTKSFLAGLGSISEVEEIRAEKSPDEGLPWIEL